MKFMVRPLLSLKRLGFDESERGMCILSGRGHSEEQERMGYEEFIARITSHIPDKGQVMVRYYGLC